MPKKSWIGLANYIAKQLLIRMKTDTRKFHLHYVLHLGRFSSGLLLLDYFLPPQTVSPLPPSSQWETAQC